MDDVKNSFGSDLVWVEQHFPKKATIHAIKEKNMRKLAKHLLPLVCLMVLCSCSPLGGAKEKAPLPQGTNGGLIYQETVSPNQSYVASEEDIVHYTVTISQNEDNLILVNASSNSAFFEEIQYTLAYDTPLSEDDIAIKWATMMGNPAATQEDQLAIAYVSIFSHNKLISERKINFLKGATEIVVEALAPAIESDGA